MKPFNTLLRNIHAARAYARPGRDSPRKGGLPGELQFGWIRSAGSTAAQNVFVRSFPMPARLMNCQNPVLAVLAVRCNRPLLTPRGILRSTCSMKTPDECPAVLVDVMLPVVADDAPALRQAMAGQSARRMMRAVHTGTRMLMVSQTEQNHEKHGPLRRQRHPQSNGDDPQLRSRHRHYGIAVERDVLQVS